MSRGATQRAFAVEPPRMDDSCVIDRAEDELGGDDRARLDDFREPLWFGERIGRKPSTNSGGIRAPDHHSFRYRYAEADPVAGGNRFQGLRCIDFDWTGRSLQRAAILRDPGRNSAAAIAAPAEHFSARKKCKRVVPAATYRLDRMMRSLGPINVLVTAWRSPLTGQGHCACEPAVPQSDSWRSRILSSTASASITGCGSRSMVLLEQSMDVRRIDGKAAATAKHICHRCYCIVAFASAIALGASDATAIFVVAEPWVRAGTNARSAEAYMELTSTEGATLIGVRCATTSSIEIR